MASKSSGVWAIDLGNNSLKALRLSATAGGVEVTGFDNIQHSKILAGSGINATERDELIALSLRQFITDNNIGKDEVIISVPSQNSFARFVNLPPVEEKRIPEIVKFEASQQIPFDINDVQWDWQLMSPSGSAEKKVGIFAIKNDVVNSLLEHFSGENLRINYVQMSAMALCNYLVYDRPELLRSDNQGTVIMNIGAENTDLLICTNSTVWQRCVPMGGNAFTKAIAETFKLNFEKAEKLKRTAAMSKYARQIFQAMRPIFTDLAAEVQRSIGFYTSSNPNTKLTKIIVFGSGTKMRGLLKYMEQTLQIPVERPDSFKRLTISEDVSKAKFHENVNDFSVVYGLGLQGLGMGKIGSNLLPRSIARSMVWAAKTKYFTLAACMLLVVSVLSFARTFTDRASYNGQARVRQDTKNVISDARQAGSKLKTQKGRSSKYESTIKNEFKLFNYRDILPRLYETLLFALPNENNTPEQQDLYRAFKNNQVGSVISIPRKERKQVFVTNISAFFTEDIGSAELSDTAMQKAGKGKGKGKGEMDDLMESMMGGMMMGPGMGGGGKESKYSIKKSSKKGGKKGEDDEVLAGFVITIAGYSPYGNLEELMEPAGVGSDQDNWGVVTRLMNLDKISDVNNPFKLYKKTDVDHFKLEFDEVDFSADMPAGIGVEDMKVRKIAGREEERRVLVDPMTRETISRMPEFDEFGKKKIDRLGNAVYEVNDHWFVLKFKLAWADAPKIAED